MKTDPDVIIIGGGLAGLASAIHLSKKGLCITLIEKSTFPRHKVCGEYISNEIIPYVDWLEVDVLQLQPASIDKLEFSTLHGKTLKTKLGLGGIGISRHALDHLLYQKAIANGCTIIQETVTGISFVEDTFTVITQNQSLTAKMVLGAYGKRSNIDQVLARDFMCKQTPWLAVKAHYSGDFPDDVVALHSFNGGYCGVSKVENNVLNICYLADLKTFKKYKNIEEYQHQVLYKNKHLQTIFKDSTLLFDKPLTISQISFEKKQPVEKHILMIGDTAGLIHPLCGNGMAMAIHSAKIVSELILDYHAGRITTRLALEKAYTQKWKENFSQRLFMGRILAKILQNNTATKTLFKTALLVPSLLPWIIKQTHGKPITI